MQGGFDSARLSEIIARATQKRITNTIAFLEAIQGEAIGEAPVTIMLNGKETTLSKEHYAMLKAQNEAIKREMKADVGALVEAFKKSCKTDGGI